MAVLWCNRARVDLGAQWRTLTLCDFASRRLQKRFLLNRHCWWIGKKCLNVCVCLCRTQPENNCQFSQNTRHALKQQKQQKPCYRSHAWGAGERRKNTAKIHGEEKVCWNEARCVRERLQYEAKYTGTMEKLMEITEKWREIVAFARAGWNRNRYMY